MTFSNIAAPDILLIHGSCHGAWAFGKVIPALATLGLTARAIDLPGHGTDTTPLPAITLDQYASAILGAMTRPTILVGHSMAGYPITAAAEADPSLIRALVYLCAYLPQDGLSLAQMRRAGPSQPLAGAIRLAPDRSSFSIDPDRANDLFYHDCPPEDRALARKSLCAEPVLPQETPLRLTARSQALPRHYIRCTNDRTIPPEYQITMAAGLPAANCHALPTSHSPFFADPVGLARLIAAIAPP